MNKKTKSNKHISSWKRLGWALLIFVCFLPLVALGFVLYALVALGFVLYAVYDCATTGCESPPDYEGKPQAIKRAVEYAKENCKKSYSKNSCDTLVGHESFYMCGFRGMCGWSIEVKSPKDSHFTYRSQANLEKSTFTDYFVTQFSEDDSANSRKAAYIINKMCKSYEPSRELNCFKDQFGLESTVIQWYENTDVGSITEYVGPYSFNLEISRKGVILDANITNFEDENEIILYKYPAIRRYPLKDRSI